MTQCHISVITVCRNAEATIWRTLDSVRRQIGVEGLFEHIVIDGASTDQTTQIVRRFPWVRWISEPDNGISDAFNKGISLSKGEYVFFLNADDYLADENVLRDVLSFAEKKRLPEWIVGDVRISHFAGNERDQYPQTGRLVPVSCWSLIFRNRICHQAVFLDRRVLVEAGGFDTSYQIAMDYELWYRLCQLGYRPMYFERAISVFSLQGTSSSNQSTYLKETKCVSYKFRDTRWKKAIGRIYDFWAKGR